MWVWPNGVPYKQIHTHTHSHLPAIGSAVEDARLYGWEISEEVTHSWAKMVDAIQNHIGSLNWGYRVALRDKGVKYINGLAEFVDPHTIKVGWAEMNCSCYSFMQYIYK